MADPNPWDALKDGVLDILKSSVKDLVDTEKPEIVALLEEIAEEGSKQSYLLLNGTDQEKAQAVGNIRSLKAQAIIDAADGVIVGVKHALAAFGKVIETVGEWLIQYGPALIAAAAK